MTINPLPSSNLKHLFRSAKKSIRIQTQYIKDPQWQGELLDALKRNVDVYLTLPSFCHFIQKESGIGFLKKSKIKGKYGMYSNWLEPYEKIGGSHFSLKIYNKGIPNLDDPPRGYQHAKIVIIDDKLAWIGSTNGSTTSIESNREYGMIFKDPQSIKYITSIAKHDHQEGMSLSDHLPNLHDLDRDIWISSPGTCKIFDPTKLRKRKRDETSKKEGL